MMLAIFTLFVVFVIVMAIRAPQPRARAPLKQLKCLPPLRPDTTQADLDEDLLRRQMRGLAYQATLRAEREARQRPRLRAVA